MKKILVVCLLCFSIQLRAQTSEMKTVEDAFSSSYTLELKAEYTAAMAILKTVYDEKIIRDQSQAGMAELPCRAFHRIFGLLPECHRPEAVFH